MSESIIAKKFNISDMKTINKTKELMLLLECRKSIQCSESCKVAVCLELACSIYDTTSIYNRDSAIKYSGCKRSVYINQFNIISKLLNLDKIYTIRELCLTLGVNELHESASMLLEKYKTLKNLSAEELEHPMITCAAVLAGARCNKVRINTSKLAELSRVKKRELEALAFEFEQLPQTVKRPLKRRADAAFKNCVPKDNDVKTKEEDNTKTVNEKDAEYLAWKMKMLEE